MVKSRHSSCLRLRSHGSTQGLRSRVNRPLIIGTHERRFGTWPHIGGCQTIEGSDALPKAARDMFLVFFNHLPYYSLTPLSPESPLQRVPELPARHACNFQICTVERFPSLAADIKSKTQRSLCSNHGVTGNSGAARVLSPGHELIAYLLIATILSRAMIGGEPAVSYR